MIKQPKIFVLDHFIWSDPCMITVQSNRILLHRSLFRIYLLCYSDNFYYNKCSKLKSIY